MKRHLVAGLLCALCSVITMPASADAGDKATARRLFFEARAALEAKRYAEAAELFERSNRIHSAPTAALGLARARAGAGQLVAAYDAYSSAIAHGAPAGSPPAFHRAVEDAKLERAALEPRLPVVILRVRGPGDPKVSIDGREISTAALDVERFVDPGKHSVTARAAGFRPETRELEIAERERRELEIELLPLTRSAPLATKRAVSRSETRPAREPAAGSGSRTAAVILMGAGGAALAVAAVSGALYLSKKSEVDDGCEEIADGRFECRDPQSADAADQGRTYAWINTISLAIGVAAAGTGLTLYVIAGTPERSGALPQPVGARLQGRF